jgi:ribonuclease P protein component
MNKVVNSNPDEKMSFTFCKAERLCSKKIIDKLFQEGKTIFTYPVKIIYSETRLTSDFPVQATFSVGKKTFKRAVKRNLIKRRMREAYRLNKSFFYEKLGDKQLAVFFIFTGKTIPEYKIIEDSIKKGIQKLIKEISGNS